MSIVPCPHCGSDIEEQATFCRHCGSSDADGWRDDWVDSAEEDDEFDYDEFVEREFSSSPQSRHLSPIWRLVSIFLLLAIAFAVLNLFF